MEAQLRELRVLPSDTSAVGYAAKPLCLHPDMLIQQVRTVFGTHCSFNGWPCLGKENHEERDANKDHYLLCSVVRKEMDVATESLTSHHRHHVIAAHANEGSSPRRSADLAERR